MVPEMRMNGMSRPLERKILSASMPVKPGIWKSEVTASQRSCASAVSSSAAVCTRREVGSNPPRRSASSASFASSSESSTIRTLTGLFTRYCAPAAVDSSSTNLSLIMRVIAGSSSTTSIRFFIGQVLSSYPKHQERRRAPFGTVRHSNGPPVHDNDAARNSKAKPGAFAHRLGSKKGVKQLILVLGRNPRSAVPDVDGNHRLPYPKHTPLGVLQITLTQAYRARDNFDAPALSHGLRRIRKQVDENLHQAVWIGKYRVH